ncbi:MupG family TIM beta-alpha barrel fold protein [Atopobiaceae bacterium 24-176]
MAIGISLYPEHASFERNAAYVERAAAHGCTRVFSCLLSAEGDRASLAGEFSALSRVCHDHGMEVVLDVAPAVFSRVGARPDDLSFFSEAGADGIRLDEGFNGSDVASMTANPHGLVVELNASTADGSLDAALACGADKGRLQACHNFFPQRYTGLGLDFFVRESSRAKDAGVRLAAFVSSSVPGAFGPWPGADGLPTLEMHRGLPVSFQARHLYALGLVDDVLVSNCFATDTELAALAAAHPGVVAMAVEPGSSVTDEERSVLAFSHRVRGDLSPCLFRSTGSRIAFADAPFAPHDTRDLVAGDVVVVNERGGRYKGELQIVRRPIPNDGTRNVVARIEGPETLLMDCLESWTPFTFVEEA